MKHVTLSMMFVLCAALAGCTADVPPEPDPTTGETTQATKVCDWVLQCSTTGALFEQFGPLQAVHAECAAHCAGGSCFVISSTECGG